MTKGILAILILWAYACIRALLNPWVGFIGYTVFVVLCPRWNWRWGWNESIDYQKFLAGGTVVGVLLTGALSKPLNATAKSSVAFLSIFLALAWLSSFNTINSYYTGLFLDSIWKIWLMASLGVWLIDDQKKLVWFIWAIILSQGWNAFNVNELYYKFGINVRYFTWNYLDNNTYSISTVPVMGVVFGVLMVVKNWRLRLLTGLVFVLQMHQLMILQSRGTMLGGLCLVALGVLFMPKTRISIQMTLIATVIGMVLAGPSVVQEFMSSFERTETIDSSAESRYKLWKAGAKIMVDNPLLGVGPWAGQFVVPRYYEGMDGSGFKALHNLFFEIGTGSGIPALIAYLLYFFIPWFGHLKLWLQGIPRPGTWEQAVNVGFLCGVPGYWTSSMFSSGALIEPPYLLVTLGCVGLQLAIDSRGQEDDSDSQDEEDLDDQDSFDEIRENVEFENYADDSEIHSVSIRERTAYEEQTQ